MLAILTQIGKTNWYDNKNNNIQVLFNLKIAQSSYKDILIYDNVKREDLSVFVEAFEEFISSFINLQVTMIKFGQSSLYVSQRNL